MVVKNKILSVINMTHVHNYVRVFINLLGNYAPSFSLQTLGKSCRSVPFVPAAVQNRLWQKRLLRNTEEPGRQAFLPHIRPSVLRENITHRNQAAFSFLTRQSVAFRWKPGLQLSLSRMPELGDCSCQCGKRAALFAVRHARGICPACT